ncbi:spore coat protein [Ammoniphilus sp. CFH 90114]|uniref:spore coat protein n=1 Tax=Ammoniphilus sp. CFH 90114 TaxID=2493665 RepID=UPI00100F7A0E|nr:spore coat protein [Ammoniphilus sp. CFH 90114]RXT13676.1 spore coat protein [Ammoniphilus sp. CFH 90114]
MNSVIEYLTGMDTLTDQVIASDLLLSSKTGIIQYAMALTEAATEEVRLILNKQLEYEIEVHERMTAYMVDKGWYHPYDISEQFAVDRTMTQTTLNLPPVPFS